MVYILPRNPSYPLLVAPLPHSMRIFYRLGVNAFSMFLFEQVKCC